MLPCHSRCIHIKGHGGAKQSAAEVHQQIRKQNTAIRPLLFVCRTDISGYYGNIDKMILYEQLAGIIWF